MKASNWNWRVIPYALCNFSIANAANCTSFLFDIVFLFSFAVISYMEDKFQPVIVANNGVNIAFGPDSCNNDGETVIEFCSLLVRNRNLQIRRELSELFWLLMLLRSVSWWAQ